VEEEMVLDKFYIYASSQDSKDRHPENQVNDFIVEPPEPIELEGTWEIGLVESCSSIKTDSTHVYLCCDLCEVSAFYGRQVPVLRKLKPKGTFRPPLPMYINVKKADIRWIHLYIVDEKLNPISSPAASFNCTIQLRRVYKE
jgi:hypothetical protein